MSGIESWSTTPASNNQAPPFGWPAGILPSQVEPIGRQMMTSLAAWYQAAEWINYNFTPTYVNATQFTLPGNVTATYHVGRRVQGTDGTTSVYGTITVSAFTTLTTVTVVWDTGVLQTGVTIVYVGLTSKTNTSAPASSALAGPVTVSAAGSGTTMTMANVGTNPGIDINNTNAVVGNPSLRLANASASAQTVIDWFTVGTVTGRIRNDFGGNMSYVSYAGIHAFFVGGDSGVGVNTFKVLSAAAGGAQVADPAATLQTVGYRGAPLNTQGVNYALVAGDAGKTVNASTTITVTVPNSVFSPGDVVAISVGNGATVTIAQGAGVTLQWAGNGATTGSRTLTGAGLATLLFLTGSAALISGAGLT